MASPSGKPVVRVDVWSDVACPWCWCGYRRLSQAMEDLQEAAQFDVHWHAFLLDPHFPEQGGWAPALVGGQGAAWPCTTCTQAVGG